MYPLDHLRSHIKRYVTFSCRENGIYHSLLRLQTFSLTPLLTSFGIAGPKDRWSTEASTEFLSSLFFSCIGCLDMGNAKTTRSTCNYMYNNDDSVLFFFIRKKSQNKQRMWISAQILDPTTCCGKASRRGASPVQCTRHIFRVMIRELQRTQNERCIREVKHEITRSYSSPHPAQTQRYGNPLTSRKAADHECLDLCISPPIAGQQPCNAYHLQPVP